MNGARSASASIDEYIARFPAEVQAVLRQMRETIRSAAPDAEETISYQIPTFTLNGTYLVYFAGFKKHVSLYPVPVEHPDFAQEMAVYGSGKGTMKFPLGEPLPIDLITRMVQHLRRENEARAAARKRER